MQPVSRTDRGRIRIGISGWRYPPWRGVFYPKGLPQKEELAYASRQFPTIEINGTFYSLQRPERFASWYSATPEDFVFAVKGGRFITHMKKLRNVEAPLANFFASGVLRLKEKLGPILWQFAPNFAFDEPRFDDFLSLLPRDTAAAVRLARSHDQRVADRSWIGRGLPAREIRHAVEIRHQSFLTPRFIALLRRHGVALVFADTVEFPYCEDITADFLYLRLHGSEELYVSGYSPAALSRWANHIASWAARRMPKDAILVGPKPATTGPPRDVYAYFDNDAKVRAPFDAIALARHLELR
jgi:uncharacterized protein YecE (DUF72 family)